MPSELTTLLGDTSLTWTERRTRLQGWTGPDADQADATPGVQRIAATGICVPSLVFTALWCSRRAAAPSLVAAARTPRHPHQLPHDLIETARP